MYVTGAKAFAAYVQIPACLRHHHGSTLCTYLRNRHTP